MANSQIKLSIKAFSANGDFPVEVWQPLQCPAWRNTEWPCLASASSGNILISQRISPTGDFVDVNAGVGTNSSHLLQEITVYSVDEPATSFIKFGTVTFRMWIVSSKWWNYNNSFVLPASHGTGSLSSRYYLNSVQIFDYTTSQAQYLQDHHDCNLIYCEFRAENFYLFYSSQPYIYERDCGPYLTKAQYTVTYNGNGSSETPLPDVITVDRHNIALPSITRTGYDFQGWNTKADGSGTNKGGAGTIASFYPENVTLYAQWTIKTIVCSFNANGGRGSMSPQSGLYNTIISLNANNFRNDGYTFWMWNTRADGSGTSYANQASIRLTEDITLYAQWRPNVLHVTFNSCGGSAPNPMVKTYNLTSSGYGTYGTLPSVTLSGFTPVGWYTIQNQKIEASTVISIFIDHTLYARWDDDGVTITFNANGGSVSETSRNVKHGNPYGGLPMPTRQGYSFIGWFTAATGGTQIFADDIVVASITLYAHWTNVGVAWWTVS